MFGEDLVMQRAMKQTKKAEWIECVQMHVTWQSDEGKLEGDRWRTICSDACGGSLYAYCRMTGDVVHERHRRERPDKVKAWVSGMYTASTRTNRNGPGLAQIR
jgi:hypothetical protein